MRSKYETKTDLYNEELLKTLLVEAGLQVKKTDVFHPFDFIATNNGSTRYIEFKKRNHNFDSGYPSLMISKNKVDNCLKIAKEDGAKFILIVQYLDCFAFCHILPELLPQAKSGGRQDRNDAHDMELCYFIDNEYFRKWHRLK